MSLRLAALHKNAQLLRSLGRLSSAQTQMHAELAVPGIGRAEDLELRPGARQKFNRIWPRAKGRPHRSLRFRSVADDTDVLEDATMSSVV